MDRQRRNPTRETEISRICAKSDVQRVGFDEESRSVKVAVSRRVGPCVMRIVELVGILGGGQDRPVTCRVNTTYKRSIMAHHVEQVPDLRDASWERMGFDGLL